MKISLKRTGGVAGAIRQWEIDLETLPPEESAELKNILNNVDFSKNQSITAVQCRDTFCYELTFEENGKTRSMQCAEETTPESLKICIDWIQNHS